jgi:hypothetical protein
MALEVAVRHRSQLQSRSHCNAHFRDRLLGRISESVPGHHNSLNLLRKNSFLTVRTRRSVRVHPFEQIFEVIEPARETG